jgi:hypothetical protein
MKKPWRKRPIFWELLILLPILEIAIYGATQSTSPTSSAMPILALALLVPPVIFIAIIILAIRKE